MTFKHGSVELDQGLFRHFLRQLVSSTVIPELLKARLSVPYLATVSSVRYLSPALAKKICGKFIMQKKTQIISGTLVSVILLFLLAANFSSLYTVGKDFGRTIYESFSNRK
ncbi:MULTISPECIES: hypothetical protein [Cyanophyceae]|uniref:hypothetical protein n=1 Tax=Cyanophyceae TaxID=3028117 RepID=UPI0016865191|nr:hypothetical protein [Trichocoleus sp. FACHB-40]